MTPNERPEARAARLPPWWPEFPRRCRASQPPIRGNVPRIRGPAGAVVLERAHDLFVRVHHERAVLRDRLVQRAAGNQDGARAIGAGRERDAVAARGVGQDRHALHRHRLIADRERAPVDVDERVVRGRQRLREAAAGRQVDVQIQRLRVLALDRAGQAVAPAGDHAHQRAVGQAQLGDIRCRDVAVPRGAHLVGRGQVEPELKAFHPAFVLLGHLAVDHAATSRHPLHAAGAEQAFVAGGVAVPHAAVEHVGHGLEAAVRMVGEAGDVVAGVVGAEGIEHQERVEPALQVLREHAGELDAGTVARGLAGDDPVDRARVVDGFRGGGCAGDGGRIHSGIVARSLPSQVQRG